MVADNPAGIQAASHFPPTRNVQAMHAYCVRRRPSKGFDPMKRAIVSVMVAVALLVTGVTMTSLNGIGTAHALEAGGDE
jgi:hypothetical protein